MDQRADTVFTACPNCGKTKSPYGADVALKIYKCECGQLYCDHCTLGGLVSNPLCPRSAYHGQHSQTGSVPI